MESWQKEHIRKNLVELIEQTNCSTLFLAKLVALDMLSSEESENLTLEKTPTKKSKRLYEILLTRVGSFDVLVDCLQETKQSGAFEILKGHHSELRSYGKISFDRNHVLGRGNSGTVVYQGTYDNRKVAVKVMHFDVVKLENALGEIEFLKKLDSHENIVRYFFAERNKDFVYIALELCLVNLDYEINSNMLMLNPDVLLRKCTKGLDHLHKLNVVHMDLKPANILLTITGQVKISDFGLSKQIPEGLTSVMVSSGAIGTIDWMAPEVLRYTFEGKLKHGKLKMTKASDVFSLGCIYFFVLSEGSHPFGIPVDRQSNIFHDRKQIENFNINGKWLQIITEMISHRHEKRPSVRHVLELIYSQSFSTDTNYREQHVGEDETFSAERHIMEIAECSLDNANGNWGAALHVAVKTGNLAAIKSILDAGIDVSLKDTKGNTALHFIEFAKQDFVEILDALLKHGGHIDARNNNGNTPLGLAAFGGKTRAELKYMIGKGADWKMKNVDGQIALHLAVKGGNFEGVLYLLELGMDPLAKDRHGNTPLHFISDATRNFEETHDALSQHVKNMNPINRYGKTPFHQAILNGKSIEQLKYMISKGADWKIKFKGYTSMHLAVIAGNSESVDYFVELKMDIHGKSENGDMPIHAIQLTKCNFKNTLDALLKHGADINGKNRDGNTPLCLVAFGGIRKEDLNYMISKGADWKFKNEFGQTVLHSAVKGGNLGGVSCLVELGIVINSTDNQGDTPLHYIQFTKENFKDILDILLEYGAAINAENSDGNTPFGLAVGRGRSKEELEYMISKGADWKKKNTSGETALHLAVAVGNFDVLEYLATDLGMNVETRDNAGNTPMHNLQFANVNFKQTLDALLKIGADINAKNKRRKTPLTLARRKGKIKEHLEYMIEEGADYLRNTKRCSLV